VSADPSEPEGGLSPQEPVPRLPRKFFGRLMMRDLFKIAFTALALVMVIMLRKPCSEGTASFFRNFDAPPDAAPPPLPYRRLTPDEIERTFPNEETPMPTPAQTPTAPGAAGRASPGASSPKAPDRSPR
jgi:hypothetical protein